MSVRSSEVELLNPRLVSAILKEGGGDREKSPHIDGVARQRSRVEEWSK